jgi:hypothetical protein
MTADIVWWLKGTTIVLGIATVPIWISCAAYGYWKTYAAYKLIGDRAERLGLYWFSAQFHLGSFASGMPGYLDPETLPVNLKMRVQTLRKEMQRSIWAMFGWLGFLILFGLSATFIKKHIAG